MTKRVLLVAVMLSAVAVGAGMVRLTTAWNQPIVLPPEGVLITVAQGEQRVALVDHLANFGQLHVIDTVEDLSDQVIQPYTHRAV